MKKNLSTVFSKEYADKICVFHKTFCPSNTINKSLHDELLDVYESISEDICLIEEGEYSINSALKTFFDLFINSGNDTPKEVFSYFSGSVAYFTTFLSVELPELFIPYYFKYNFNIFEKIAQEFDINIPELPPKKDYLGRFFYYGEICKSLYDFREAHNMSPYELCAFLYDFAPKYVGGIDSYIIKDIPVAKSAYFIGGSKDDAFLSEDEDVITPWQCNPDTMAGDAIVMYLKSPISAIDSVWRSVSVGFNDPFFYYYRCTYIANPQKINRVYQKTLKRDPVFKELPIVKKNMQGINGVELFPSVYNHLLNIAKSNLPRLEFTINNNDMVLSSEEDMENKLIKPFLKELGYNESDYRQQLRIEIGNHNHALIPDFVIHPIVSKGHQSDDFLIEAKLSIPSNKILEETKTQSRGYAKLLNAKYSIIAAKEGIWIMDSFDDYSDSIIALTWTDLQNEDNFYEVFNIIGNGKI